MATLSAVAGAMLLTGCVYRSETTPAASPGTTVVVSAPPSQRVYTYPEGRYELHGAGTPASPYVWVWIPTGVTPPAPPPLPATPAR